MKLTGIIFLFIFASCRVSKKMAKSANKLLLTDSALLHTHVGISIFEPATGTYWYNHNGDKYFVPASNTKILTCYAAMKYLGDSLIGLQFKRDHDFYEIYGTGDPSFMHPDFPYQPVFEFFKKIGTRYNLNVSNFKEEPLGDGWAWSDYSSEDMAERSPLPIYGNLMLIREQDARLTSFPSFFLDPHYVIPDGPTKTIPLLADSKYDVVRELYNNDVTVKPASSKFQSKLIPFITSAGLVTRLLYDTLGAYYNSHKPDTGTGRGQTVESVKTQPTDSILKPMMHRSDNFFAEQSLLMVSNIKLGYMQDEGIIRYLKEHDFTGMPQMPRWVDGSGLSRYNMITPQSLVWILNKMKHEFGMERIKNIFATGGEGTIRNYYKNMKGFIFAKTGTLSNHAALSGFLYTKKNRLLIFSVLTSGWQGSATPVRKAVEKFLQSIREKY